MQIDNTVRSVDCHTGYDVKFIGDTGNLLLTFVQDRCLITVTVTFADGHTALP